MEEDAVLFETKRLIHRVARRDEGDVLCAIMGDPEVMRLVGDGKPMPADRVGRRLRSDIDNFRNYGAAHGMVVLKETMAVIGYGGVGRYERDKPESLELGYQFARPFWGMGLGGEFVQAVVDYGFVSLEAELIHACAMPENKASIRIMEKAGMAFEGYYAETHRNVYAIDRAQYLAARAGA